MEVGRLRRENQKIFKFFKLLSVSRWRIVIFNAVKYLDERHITKTTRV